MALGVLDARGAAEQADAWRRRRYDNDIGRDELLAVRQQQKQQQQHQQTAIAATDVVAFSAFACDWIPAVTSVPYN